MKGKKCWDFSWEKTSFYVFSFSFYFLFFNYFEEVFEIMPRRKIWFLKWKLMFNLMKSMSPNQKSSQKGKFPLFPVGIGEEERQVVVCCRCSCTIWRFMRMTMIRLKWGLKKMKILLSWLMIWPLVIIKQFKLVVRKKMNRLKHKEEEEEKKNGLMPISTKSFWIGIWMGERRWFNPVFWIVFENAYESKQRKQLL